ncbi:hypothetical protein [Mycobacteroides abscessus]|nr:hypothetical protein [Mycobacteroides abscessus]SHY28206.1 Uncharacterised protein [Mycobacteroides abscessus subsp. abscessus]SID71882.1 Uncharacterised protein [Mycobacteroides abscessus subsp. abscessus]SIK18732.1 Uncharacterised protein [Mycobacteroides abscessus subsp. abscessus]SIM43129.1 Uncharacterised protein [Mycobacteroides abscessus subsp. abscessus]SKL79597.1 Uncharacterised protein [Mycobacteroides abscessus subsp. massiliense]
MVDSIANTEARNQVGKALQEIEMADHGGELVFKVGDRVAVRSVLCGPVPRRRTDPRRRPAEGTIEAFETAPVIGVRVRFERPVNGSDNCLASYSELIRVQ